jgi:hypothetical protein
MTEQKGRDNEEEITRRDGMTEGETGTARQSPDVGMAGGAAGVDTESVDFDDMGDLDRGAADDRDTDVSTGPGPGYGMDRGMAGTASASTETTGAGSTWEQSGQAEQSTAGQGAGTDMAGGARSVTGPIEDLGNLTDSGAGRGTASAMRVTNETEATGGMGTGIGDDDGYGAGTDMDPSIARGDMASTGTSSRAGLGGPSSGNTMDVEPAAGSGMANPADMGDQG